MLHVGYGNYIKKSRITAITGAEGKGLSKVRQRAAEENKLIDCTRGKKVDSLIHLDNGAVVTSAIQAETLVKRLEGKSEE